MHPYRRKTKKELNLWRLSSFQLCVVEQAIIVADHLVGRAFGFCRVDGGHHHGCPDTRLVVSRKHVFFQSLVEIVGIGVAVLRFGTADEPAVYRVAAALGPPTVGSGEVKNAVRGCLHARSRASFERNLRIGEPEVATLGHVATDFRVVVLQEDHVLRVLLRHLVEVLQDALAGEVARMGLAGENDLNVMITDQLFEAVEVVEDQIGTLVFDDATGEADDNVIRVKLDAVALFDEVDQALLMALVDLVDVAVQALAIGATDIHGLPVFEVYAIVNVVDGAGVTNVLPEVARGRLMTESDGIGKAGQTESGDGRTEHSLRMMFANFTELDMTQPEVTVKTGNHVDRIRLVAGADGRVGREDRMVADHLTGGNKVKSTLHEFSHLIDGGKNAVSFVEMENIEVVAELLGEKNAADAKDNFLHQTLILAAVITESIFPVKGVGNVLELIILRKIGIQPIGDRNITVLPDLHVDVTEDHGDRENDSGVNVVTSKVLFRELVFYAIIGDRLLDVATELIERGYSHKSGVVTVHRAYSVAVKGAEAAGVVVATCCGFHADGEDFLASKQIVFGVVHNKTSFLYVRSKCETTERRLRHSLLEG